MKSSYVYVVLIGCLFAGLLLFYKNTRQPTDVDRLQHSVATIKRYLKPGTTLGIMTIDRDLEVEDKLQYVLAPVPADYGLMDTTLFLLPRDSTDATIDAMLKSRIAIIDCSDSQYRYILTKAH